MTFSEIQVQTFKMLGEDPTVGFDAELNIIYAPVYWTYDEIKRYINDVYSDVCLDTKALECIEALAVDPATSTSTYSSFVSLIRRVTFDDRKMLNLSKIELDARDENWENRTGYVSNYVTTQYDNGVLSFYEKWDGSESYALNSFFNDGQYAYTAWASATAYGVGDRVTVDSPSMPGNTAGYICKLGHTSSLTTQPGVGANWKTNWTPIPAAVWAVKNPVGLVNSEDVPELPAWCHVGLSYGAAARALLKFGEQRNEALANLYQAAADEYWKMIKTIVGNRTSEFTVSMGRAYPTRGVRPYPWPPLVQV